MDCGMHRGAGTDSSLACIVRMYNVCCSVQIVVEGTTGWDARFVVWMGAGDKIVSPFFVVPANNHREGVEGGGVGKNKENSPTNDEWECWR